jgi:hypothetical protein
MPLLGGLALIAIAFVIGSIAIGHGIRDRNQNNVIVVTGSAKKRITSDYVIWTLSVTSTQPSATDAAKELSGWTKDPVVPHRPRRPARRALGSADLDRGDLERRSGARLQADAEL